MADQYGLANPRAFGARADGIADDSDAIRSAIASLAQGGTVYVPPGSYRIESTIELSLNVTIRGAGMGATKLLHFCGADPVLQRRNLSPGDSYNSMMGICDLQILGNPDQSGDGIQLNGRSDSGAITNVAINNVWFNSLYGDSSCAVRANLALETYITGCRVWGCRGNGFVLEGQSNASVIRDCNLSNGGYGSGWAIKLVHSADGRTDGCLVEGCVVEAWRGDGGLILSGAYHALIRNWFEDIRGIEISIGDATDTWYKDGISLIGNNCQGGAGVTASLDTPQGTSGIRGCRSMTLVGNSFAGDVLLKPAGGAPSKYVILGGSGRVVDTTVPGVDSVWIV